MSSRSGILGPRPHTHSRNGRVDNRTMGKHYQKWFPSISEIDQYLHFIRWTCHSSVQETTGQTSANVVFGRELRLPCNRQFGCKPDDNVVCDDYVYHVKKRMEAIHGEFAVIARIRWVPVIGRSSVITSEQ